MSPAPFVRSHVLVVDDYHDAADMLAGLLGLLGQDCDVAYNGRDGLAMAKARPPELAVLDIGMPDLNGYEVARELRRQLGRDVYLVAMTGWGKDEDRAHAFEAGFDEHLLKPANAAMMRDVLGRLAQWREARRTAVAEHA